MQFSKHAAVCFLAGSLIILVGGCQPNIEVEVVDLNKVLDIFDQTLQQLDGDDKEATSAEQLKDVTEEDKDKESEFLTKFANNLNQAKLIKGPIGVEFASAGTIDGFSDKDGNNIRSTSEKQLFSLDLDPARNRVVATDNGGHYRDHQYRPRFGFFTGYMLGSMMNRSNSYYTGARATSKPDYSNKSMSPKNYHASAVSKAKTAARASYRSRSGSRGFSFGK